MIHEIYLLIKSFTNRLKKDNVSAFSAQAAFFLILSIVPFLSLLLSIISILPIKESFVIGTVLDIVPKPFSPLVKSILEDLFQKGSGTILSVSALVAIWTAAKGVLAIIRGLNSVYHIEEKRNYFILRFFSAIYTVLFISALIITLILLVFSNQIYHAFLDHSPFIAELMSGFIHKKIILSFCILTLFFIFAYKLVERKKFKGLSLLPGAIFSSIGWILFSYAFSIYIDKYSNFSYMYGGLTTIVLLMLWVYFCMYILFIGAEINDYFKLYFEMSTSYFRKKFKKNSKTQS